MIIPSVPFAERKDDKMAQVTVVIPAYNVGAYLAQTMDSVVGQTLRDIEIIPVDDGSTDDGWAILADYAGRDARVRPIRHEKNRSIIQARKTGVLAATGEYLMYLDGDDELLPDACERAVRAIRKSRVDLLEFGIEVINVGQLEEAAFRGFTRSIQPANTKHHGIDIPNLFYGKQEISPVVWGCIASTALWKKVMAHVGSSPITIAEDHLLKLILLFYAKSYRGRPDLCLTRYYYGRGIWGHKKQPLGTLEKFTQGHALLAELKTFLRSENIWETHHHLWALQRLRLINDSGNTWFGLHPRDQGAGLEVLMALWEPHEVAAMLCRLTSSRDRRPLLQALPKAQWKRPGGRPLRVVGTFYPRLRNGGIQRVLTLQIPLWQAMGYNVVLFTDEAPHADDYTLPDGAIRVVLPPLSDGDAHGRFASLQAALVEHRVDLMVNQEGHSESSFLWDTIVVKGMGVPVILHIHIHYAMLLSGKARQHTLFPLAGWYDAMIVLSRVDARFWQLLARRVFQIVNPMPLHPAEVNIAPLSSGHILWIGRFDPYHKRPGDVLDILPLVLEAVPETVLDMVGVNDDDPQYAQRFAREIRAKGLEKSVRLHGYHKDVNRFYEQASVLLSTSRAEGFSTTMMEAAAHGVPCVTYDLPYMESLRDGRGFTVVPQEDTEAAAREIVRLLKDDTARREAGRQARALVEEALARDLPGAWQTIFDTVMDPQREAPPIRDAEPERTETIFLQAMVSQMNELLQKADAREQALADALSQLRNSLSLRIGRAVTAFPRFLRDRLRGSDTIE